MIRDPSQLERRKQPRTAPKGSVTLTLASATLRGRVANISRGGVFVATRVSSPERLLGRAVTVELRLDGPVAEWLVAQGRVVRIDARGTAVCFDHVSAELDAALTVVAREALTQRSVIAVVLIDGDAQRAAAMAESFRGAGCTVLHVSTPLEAIVRLGEATFEPDLIAIGDTTSAVADELRAFVERSHPDTRLVAIGREPAAEVARPWLASIDPTSDVPARVHELLGAARRR